MHTHRTATSSFQTLIRQAAQALLVTGLLFQVACSDPAPEPEEAPKAVENPVLGAVKQEAPVPVVKTTPVRRWQPELEEEPVGADADAVARADRRAAGLEREERQEAKPELVPAEVSMVSLKIATDIDKRAPQGVATNFSLRQKKLWAWVKVNNDEAPTEIKMVWKRNGRVRSQVTLKVGVSPAWRTWSSKTLGPKDAGDWSVEVFDGYGKKIGETAFTISPGEQAAVTSSKAPRSL